jgi:hypothetical protein
MMRIATPQYFRQISEQSQEVSGKLDMAEFRAEGIK